MFGQKVELAERNTAVWVQRSAQPRTTDEIVSMFIENLVQLGAESYYVARCGVGSILLFSYAILHHYYSGRLSSIFHH